VGVSLHSPTLLVKITYPLEDLLPPHVLQPAVQVPDLLRQIIELGLVRALDLGLADGQVQREFHARVDATAEPCAALLDILGHDAKPMLAAVGSAEGELASAGTALGDDAVVVVEGLLDGDEDADVGLGDVVLCGVVPDFGVVVACANWLRCSGRCGAERIPTTSVSFSSSSKKHFCTAPSIKKCSACEGTARTAARNTDDCHMVRGGVPLKLCAFPLVRTFFLEISQHRAACGPPG